MHFTINCINFYRGHLTFWYCQSSVKTDNRVSVYNVKYEQVTCFIRRPISFLFWLMVLLKFQRNGWVRNTLFITNLTKFLKFLPFFTPLRHFIIFSFLLICPPVSLSSCKRFTEQYSVVLCPVTWRTVWVSSDASYNDADCRIRCIEMVEPDVLN